MIDQENILRQVLYMEVKEHRQCLLQKKEVGMRGRHVARHSMR